MRVLFHISIIFIICSCSVDNRRQPGELDEARRLLPDNAAEAFERIFGTGREDGR